MRKSLDAILAANIYYTKEVLDLVYLSMALRYNNIMFISLMKTSTQCQFLK